MNDFPIQRIGFPKEARCCLSDMVKRKLGHNWKARVQNETRIDESAEKRIALDLETLGVHRDCYDASNPIALPAEGRKVSAVAVGPTSAKRALSKKERRRLEAVLERRRKKDKRAQLLGELGRVQASGDELSRLQSVVLLSRHKKTEKKGAGASAGNCPPPPPSSSSRQQHPEPSSSSSSGEPSEDDDSDTDDNGSSGNHCDVVLPTAVATAAARASEGAASVAIADRQAATPVQLPSRPAAGSSVMPSRQPAVHIPVDRPADIQAARRGLPILAEEQQIMEKIIENPVVIICGETGSGKTTQLPQFLYEAGYATNSRMIGVTEPRRVAAISMSKRVAAELQLTEEQVAYQIRFEGTVSDKTLIKFMTDGVLLKELQQDFLLGRYSAIVIDEAHERSAYTDILIGLLSRVVRLRAKRGNPLKLIIMSATLRVEDFVENGQLFATPPPVVKVDSRQHSVTVHFNRFTPIDDYMGETLRKVCKIHRERPEGGILVFVTGQQEVNTLCRRLRDLFPSHGAAASRPGSDGKRAPAGDDSTADKPVVISLDSYSALPVDEQADLMAAGADDGAAADKDEEASLVERMANDKNLPLHVLPLYSLLPSRRQLQVFEAPPAGCRLCVIATNVAETSLTIPNIKYVVDTGKVKIKLYDKVTGVSTFRVCWTSKASADQRAGRAGRTGPGHCFRLYSSSVFNDEFKQFSEPEISSRPVEDLVLQMKAMGIDRVINFPFPTAPAPEALKAAEELLVSLGALELHAANGRKVVQQTKGNAKGKAPAATFLTRITATGRTMALFPLSPRYAKMLMQAEQHSLLEYTICLVSAFTVREIFTDGCHVTIEDDADVKETKAKLRQIRKAWAGSGELRQLGDAAVYLKAVGASEYADCTAEFCRTYGLRQSAMVEVRKLRHQLTGIVNSIWLHARTAVNKNMLPPSPEQARQLRQVILSGLVDRVARFAPTSIAADSGVEKSNNDGSGITRAEMKHTYQCSIFDELIHIHPDSVLYREDDRYVIFQEAVESSGKMFAKGVTAVEPEWLPALAAGLCQFSAPLADPEPCYDAVRGIVLCHFTSTYGPHAWQMPAVQLEYPAGLDRYKWFAKFLLEGKVVPGMAKYSRTLLSSPSTMVKFWAKLQPRTDGLLKALCKAGVDSAAKLTEAWRQDPLYLLQPYTDWLPQALHKEVTDAWPPTA